MDVEQIDVPAGALASDTDITIQPITNTAWGGIGNGYRLTPDGLTFTQPVDLVFDVAPETLAGNNKTKTPPLVFLTDENSPSTEMIGGLQAAKMAFVIQDGETTADAGAVTTTLQLPDSVEVKMRTAELIGFEVPPPPTPVVRNHGA